MTQATGSKKILVVDDEIDVTELVGYHLSAKGYAVDLVQDPSKVMGRIRSWQPDLVLLDIMMPGFSGIQICRMMRADPRLKEIPVIFLSARTEENDRVQGLETGADDYVCKPFSPRELILRVESVLRRRGGAGDTPVAKLRVGGVLLDAEVHAVSVRGTPVELTATEFKLLRLLMERKGRVQARDHLLTRVWNYDSKIETRTVDTHIRRLREKMGDEAELIETVRGVGYRMVDRPPQPC
ncbi:MAG: DNA-binding response regulator [Puniceicoccaceae bacterium]|nr:MAG: DNA-binding response regulator [Puniceicoccaceae bacterium]